MKRGEQIIRLGWILIGLLAIGAAVIAMTKPSGEEKPLATSFDPGGAAAFAELLRRQGYSVEIYPSIPSAPKRDTLVIVFLGRSDIAMSPDEAKANDDSSKSDNTSDEYRSFMPKPKPALIYVSNQLRSGANAFVLGYEHGAEFSPGSKNNSNDGKATQLAISGADGRKYSLGIIAGFESIPTDLAVADAQFVAWQGTGPFASMDSVNGGRAVVLPYGELAMNALIDQFDNAKFLVDAVKTVAPASKKILIVDGAVTGAGEEGLLDVLGPWAHGIEVQLIILAVVVVYTLGKRFGLAEETPRIQRGARELLDGISDTYARARAGKAALQQVVKDSDRAVRRALKLPSDAPRKKRDELLPVSVSYALTACEHALMQDPNPSESLELARRLETELEVFLSRRKILAKRGRRRVKSA